MTIANRGHWYEPVALDLTFSDTFEVSGPMSREEARLWMDRFGDGWPWHNGRLPRAAQIVYLGLPPQVLMEGART